MFDKSAFGIWMFALVWWIWWLVVASTAAIVLSVIVWSFRLDDEYVIPAAQVKKEHEDWLDLVRRTTPVDRDLEYDAANQGYAKTELEG